MIISIYAFVVMLLSLPLMIVVSRFEMKKLLSSVIFVFVGFQLLSAVSTSYYMLMLSRIGVACAHAIFWTAYWQSHRAAYWMADDISLHRNIRFCPHDLPYADTSESTESGNFLIAKAAVPFQKVSLVGFFYYFIYYRYLILHRIQLYRAIFKTGCRATG